MIDYRINDFIADRDYVAAVGSCHWTAKRNGVRVDTPKVDIWRMRDGRAVQFFEIFDTHAAFTAATTP